MLLWEGVSTFVPGASRSAEVDRETRSGRAAKHGGGLALAVLFALAGFAPAASAAVPTVTISANPVSIVSGQSAKLTWCSSGAKSCTASGNWSGSKSTCGSKTVAPTSSATYKLTCKNSSGSSSAAAKVTVTASSAPTVSLSANPGSISLGQSSTLSWSSSNATSCTASGGWSGDKTVSGMQSVSPTANTTYTLSCSGAGGTASQTASVTVTAAAPVVSLSANPSSISSGQSSTLSWSSSNATSCSASGGWSGSKSLSGSQSVSPGSSTTYTLTCSGSGGSASGSASVNVSSGGGQAQGFGADTPGGTGKPVYRVTNLNDSGAGSLRDALSQGNRHIVFDVGGTIQAKSNVYVQGAFLTIDGSTAPSPGITLSGWGLNLYGTKGAHDVIIRGIRIRNAGANGVGDGITITDDAYNILVDHVSIGDTADGSIDVTRNAHDVTIQWSLFERKSSHNLLSITSYGATRVTYHHNLFIEGESRSPQAAWNIAGTPPEIVADIRNNLIWNFGEYGTTVLHGAIANVVGNYYYSATQSSAARALKVKTSEGSKAYAKGNFSQNGANVDGQGTQSVPYAFEPVDTTDACTAAKAIVAQAGPRPLDAQDQGFVSKVNLSCN